MAGVSRWTLATGLVTGLAEGLVNISFGSLRLRAACLVTRVTARTLSLGFERLVRPGGSR
jgi:hypothetical protein